MICYKCKKMIEIGNPKKHGLHEECFMKWFGVDKGIDFEDLTIKSTTLADPIDKNDDTIAGDIASSFFQGKFKKYSASLNGEGYILKVKDKRYPELPGTEFLCNNIAVLLGINVAKFYFINFEERLETFVSKNFIPNFIPADLIHIYHYFKEGDSYDFDTIIKIIKENTGRLEDIVRFIELCLFDALIGNHDRHGRNIAFIQKSNKCFLSPFYDNPAYLGMEDEELLGAQHEPKGKIIVKDVSEPSIGDYYKEAKRLGYLDVALAFADRVDLGEIENLVGESFISQKRRKAFFSLVQRRYRELQHEIQN